MHRSLRPGGLLLDVHPQPQPSPIEIRTGAGTTDLGQLEDSPGLIGTMSNADEALASLDRDGTFRNEREEEFLLLHHFESLTEWQDYIEGSAVLPAASRDHDRDDRSGAGDSWGGARYQRMGPGQPFQAAGLKAQ